MSNEIGSQLIEYMRRIVSYQQVAAVAIVMVGAWLIQAVIGRALRRMYDRLSTSKPWVEALVLVVGRIKFPLVAILLNKLVIELFRDYTENIRGLEIAGQLFSLWLLYRFIVALLEINLSDTYARFWSRKIVLPLIVLGGMLSVLGVLGDILTWGFTIESIGWTLTIGSILLAGFIALVFFVTSRWAHRTLAHSFLPQAGLEPAISLTISKVIAYTIVLVGVLISLSAIGIDLTGLTVIAGGLSVGLAFGLQEIFNNFISGFIIMFERSVEPGDVIQVGTNTGIVQRVGVRSTTIATRDNVELIIPNSNLLTEVVTNMTRSEKLVRTRIAVGVTYNADPRQVKEALLAAANKHETVLRHPPPGVLFKDFGDSSLNFELLVWTDEAVQLPALTSDLRYHIWDELAARHIEIPFPQRDIHIKSGVPWTKLGATETQDDKHT